MVKVQAAGALGRAVTLAWLAGAPILSAQAPRNLDPGVRVERLLAPGEVHVFAMPLLSGQFVRVIVEQNHLDVALRALSPEGVVLGEVDNSADRADSLSLSLVAEREGIRRVEIRLRSRTSVAGRYTLTVEAPRAATADDGKRLAAERLLSDGDHLQARASAETSKGAMERYEKVLAAWHELGDAREEAATLGRLSDALSGQGDLRQALARAEQALALWQLVGDRRGEAAALDRVGLAHSEVGEQRRALEFLEQALALRRADGDLRGQAETFNDIAVARGALGELPEAVARYTDALKFAQAAGDRFGAAMIAKNRATDYIGLGETDRALADFRDALARFRAMGNRREEGITLYAIGNLDLDRNDVPGALRHYGLALGLLREVGDKRFEAFTLNHMGLAHLAARTPDKALPDFELARTLLHACADRRGEAMVLANIGRALLDKGDVVEARDRLRQALPEVQASSDRVHETIALLHLARAERALGNLEASRERIEEALRLTESLRGSIPGVGERASFMARTRDRYELLIDVLMDLHAKEPGRGWDAEALHASERAKARSLVELLAEAHIDLREGIEETLLAEERTLDAQLETRRREEQRRLAGTASPEPSGSSPRALDALLAEYEDVQGRVRAASPRYGALSRPQPLSLKEIREQVLDRDTLLLEYALGEERSFVWAATSDTLTSHELPKRAVVEAAARRLYEAWSVGNALGQAEVGRRARALSEMLLGPVADQLGDKRLAIVAEGALQYLPFAALPSPRGGASAVPLVATHEVVSLPSATTLAVLRREASGRSAPGLRVAVLADPVFDRRDPRVLGRGASGGSAPNVVDDALTRSMQETGLRRLERLSASRREAQAISALAGPGGSYVALDFQASRATALGAEVSGARIVHFASHGLLNGRHPELSGVVLSLVDERGRPKDGFLQTRDIYKLRLSADLVVLSACQTALGKEVRGEGLLGLARGFMYAGAPRIVASLWQVPDRATSELMKHFYEGVLQQGLRPTAALRAAQLAIRRAKRWRSPYYWAAFTLQGDWN
jgi:CHAT domain-containing protein